MNSYHEILYCKKIARKKERKCNKIPAMLNRFAVYLVWW